MIVGITPCFGWPSNYQVLWASFTPDRLVFVEDEDTSVGNVQVPSSLFANKVDAKFAIMMTMDFDARIRRLVVDYGKIELEGLIKAGTRLKKRLGPADVKSFTDALEAGEIAKAATIVTKFYDTKYVKFQETSSKAVYKGAVHFEGDDVRPKAHELLTIASGLLAESKRNAAAREEAGLNSDAAEMPELKVAGLPSGAASTNNATAGAAAVGAGTTGTTGAAPVDPTSMDSARGCLQDPESDVRMKIVTVEVEDDPVESAASKVVGSAAGVANAADDGWWQTLQPQFVVAAVAVVAALAMVAMRKANGHA